jgi:DNA gyrase/topoisomerase IV subunit A
MATREEDFIERLEVVYSHSTLMFFTNLGRVQTLRAFQIPEASRTAKGSNIVNLLSLSGGEKVTAMISVNEFTEGEYLTMVTKQGIIKKTLLKEYEENPDEKAFKDKVESFFTITDFSKIANELIKCPNDLSLMFVNYHSHRIIRSYRLH